VVGAGGHVLDLDSNMIVESIAVRGSLRIVGIFADWTLSEALWWHTGIELHLLLFHHPHFPEHGFHALHVSVPFLSDRIYHAHDPVIRFDHGILFLDVVAQGSCVDVYEEGGDDLAAAWCWRPVVTWVSRANWRGWMQNGQDWDVCC
jgi:hypothetical protein